MGMGERVALLVEDNPIVRAATRDALEDLGFRVVEAADGKAAIARYEATAPDLVLLDVMLPECSGYEVCEHIRSQRGPRVPVLMVSARSNPIERAHAYDAGADAFLAKPFTLKQLKSVLQELMRPRAAASVPEAGSAL